MGSGACTKGHGCRTAAIGRGSSTDGQRSGHGPPILWRLPERTPDPFVRRGARKHVAVAGGVRANVAPGRTCNRRAWRCDPARATWRYEHAFELAAVKDLLGGLEEVVRHRDRDGRSRGIGCGYRAMLDEDIDDEIIVLLRDGKAYIWDGWHAVAAALVSGRTTLKAIVGVPHPDGAPRQG
jgi:hypothetical protein